MEACPGYPRRPARRRNADVLCERGGCHQQSFPSVRLNPDSAATFSWTSRILCAGASSFSRPTTLASNWRTLAFTCRGPPASPVLLRRSPFGGQPRRALRHADRCEERTPSRRSSRPTSPGRVRRSEFFEDPKSEPGSELVPGHLATISGSPGPGRQRPSLPSNRCLFSPLVTSAPYSKPTRSRCRNHICREGLTKRGLPWRRLQLPAPSACRLERDPAGQRTPPTWEDLHGLGSGYPERSPHRSRLPLVKLRDWECQQQGLHCTSSPHVPDPNGVTQRPLC